MWPFKKVILLATMFFCSVAAQVVFAKTPSPTQHPGVTNSNDLRPREDYNGAFDLVGRDAETAFYQRLVELKAIKFHIVIADEFYDKKHFIGSYPLRQLEGTVCGTFQTYIKYQSTVDVWPQFDCKMAVKYSGERYNKENIHIGVSISVENGNYTAIVQELVFPEEPKLPPNPLFRWKVQLPVDASAGYEETRQKFIRSVEDLMITVAGYHTNHELIKYKLLP